MNTPTTTPALDFAQIRTTCPNAFAALIGWFCQGKAFLYTPTVTSPQPDPELGRIGRDWLDLRDGQLSLGDFRYAYDLNPRDLFDFFDASGVYVAVMACFGEPTVFTYDFVIGGMSDDDSSAPHPTRAAAEAAAFTAGFEKLEEILKQKEG